MTEMISSQLYLSCFLKDTNRKKKTKPMKTTPRPGGSALSKGPAFLLTGLVLGLPQAAHLKPDGPCRSALSSLAFSCLIPSVSWR